MENVLWYGLSHMNVFLNHYSHQKVLAAIRNYILQRLDLSNINIDKNKKSKFF